jgi:ABC-2 type transport system permease protein
MRTFREFLRIYVRILLHFFFPPRFKTYVTFLAIFTIGLSILVAEYLGFQRLFVMIAAIDEFPLFFVRFLLERFFGLIFLISYSMLYMSSIINGLSVFFLSANLPFLRTLPVERWKILSIKFVENWFVSAYLVVGFLLCFLLSYSRSFHLGWPALGQRVLFLLLFTLSPVALGSCTVALLVRFFPVRKIHKLVTVLGGLFLTLLIVAVRLMQPEKLLKPNSTDDLVRLIQDLTVPSLSHLPSSWAANSMVYGAGRTTLLLTVFTGACFVLLALVLRRFYDHAFVHSQESRTLPLKPQLKHLRSPKKRGKVHALAVKDLKLFLRDATQWSQLLLLAGLVVVYLLNIKNLAVDLPMVRWFVSFINLGLAGFVLAALSVRFLFPSISIEGKSFWIMRTVPVSLRTLLWSKYLIYFPPFLLFTELLVYFSNRILRVPAFFVHLSIINVFAISFALTGLAIGIGALLPNFKADHPSKIAVGPGGVLYMLLSLAYIACMMLIQLRPVWYRVISHQDPWPPGLYIGAGLLLTFMVALIPLEWGARRISKAEF